MISDEAQARKLARAIVSDIRLYNHERLARGDRLDDEVAYGRELFQTRVDPALVEIFSQEAASLQSSPQAPAPGPEPGRKPALMFDERPLPSSTRLSGSAVILVALCLVAVIGAAIWWLLRAH